MMSALRRREESWQNVTIVLIGWVNGTVTRKMGFKELRTSPMAPRALPPDVFKIQDEKLDMPFGLKENLFLIFAHFFHFIPSSFKYLRLSA